MNLASCECEENIDTQLNKNETIYDPKMIIRIEPCNPTWQPWHAGLPAWAMVGKSTLNLFSFISSSGRDWQNGLMTPLPILYTRPTKDSNFQGSMFHEGLPNRSFKETYAYETLTRAIRIAAPIKRGAIWTIWLHMRVMNPYKACWTLGTNLYTAWRRRWEGNMPRWPFCIQSRFVIEHLQSQCSQAAPFHLGRLLPQRVTNDGITFGLKTPNVRKLYENLMFVIFLRFPLYYVHFFLVKLSDQANQC